jgi:two-component system sensor histidine kinase/response regulator
MPPSLVNRVAVRFALIAAFLIPATIFSCMSTTWLITIAVQVENCHEIIGCLKDLGTLLRDAETGQRGFLLTGNAEYLSPYDEATTLIERKLDTLAALARSDHPSQTRMAEELKLLVREKLAELSETIRFQTAGDVEAALRLVKTGRGIQVMTKIRNLVEFSDSYEQRRLHEAAATARVVRRIMVALNVACTLATLLLLFTVFHHISREIRERTRAEEELARAKDVAESTTRVKSEFLANMSHEIRTPMNGIMGMTDLLLETELSSRQREYLGLVKASADSLLTVINDILDYSKIEAGKFQLLPLPFQFRDIMEETVRTLALRAHAKGLELACRIAPDVPDRLVGDYGRLRQILVNLVGNAIKFTERGEIFLQAELQGGTGDGEVNIHFSVIDTGVGIPAEKLVSIFEPFEQADSSTTRYYGGTGLGLAISGKLVRSMGGQIWVESRVGLGSTFHFNAQFSRQSKTATIGESQVRAPFEGARVLVVDDNATNRRILIEVLTNWDIDPVAVDSGPAALTALQGAINLGRPFAVAILDMMMPAMDGQALANRIRADPAFSGTYLLTFRTVV